MRTFLSVFYKLWHGILDAIAWLTKESPAITQKKRRRDINYIRLRGFGKK